MNKSILKSLRPKTVANILNGDATLFISRDVRLYKSTKKLIGEQGYATFFMYCTKEKNGWCMVGLNGIKTFYQNFNRDVSYSPNHHYIGNGKVVAKFTVRKVEEIETSRNEPFMLGCYKTNTMGEPTLLKLSCLRFRELDNYLRYKNGFAYYIEDLVIFDSPEELSEFYLLKECRRCRTQCVCYNKGIPCMETLTKAPQNYCFVKSEE